MVTVDTCLVGNKVSTTTTSDLIHSQQSVPREQQQQTAAERSTRTMASVHTSTSSSRSGSSGEDDKLNLTNDQHGENQIPGLSTIQVTESFLALLGSNFKILPATDPVRELQTILRDKNTSRSDFVFYADRLIRLIVEEGLNKLPYEEHAIITPTGAEYKGLKYLKGNCGVSIVRSGESMEQGLRDCCRSIRIGKILVQKDEDTHEARVVYTKFPEDISVRKVLLMYPIMSSGNTVIKAVRILRMHGVRDHNIILLNLFCTPQAAKVVTETYPDLHILTSEVNVIAPTHFGTKYFGTD